MSTHYTRTESAIGVFVLLGASALAYLSVSIGGVQLFGTPGTRIGARFASVGDLKSNAAVKIAGVSVGRVETIQLENYAAEVELSVDKKISLPADTIASIRTEGLLGESYVLLRPGASEENLASGERLTQTEAAVDLIDLVVKYALNKDSDEPSLDDPLLDEEED